MDKRVEKDMEKLRKKSFVSIQYKLILPVVVVIGIAGFLVTLLVYRQVFDLLIRFSADQLQQVLTDKVDETNKVLVGVKKVVRGVVQNESVIKLVAEKDEGLKDDVLSILNNYNVEDKFSALYVMNREGLTLVSTDRSFEGQNYSFRDYFVEALSGEPYLDVAVGVTSNELGYYCSPTSS